MAQIHILKKVVKIKDRTGKSITFRSETWESIKSKIIDKNHIPIEITKFLTLSESEKTQLLSIVIDETNVEDEWIYNDYNF